MARTVTMKGNPLELEGPELRAGDRAPEFRLHAKDLSDVTLRDFEGRVLLLSVVPSLDTGVCAMQTKRFNEEAAKLPDSVRILTVSCDLPFAQARFCGENDIAIPTASDHRDVSFGKAYGTLIPSLRIECRALFVVDPTGTIRHAEYVPELTNEPNYDAALSVVRSLIS
ncbi:MAG: putative thiol peroxidase [Fimbriimonadales bacterium]